MFAAHHRLDAMALSWAPSAPGSNSTTTNSVDIRTFCQCTVDRGNIQTRRVECLKVFFALDWPGFRRARQGHGAKYSPCRSRAGDTPDAQIDRIYEANVLPDQSPTIHPEMFRLDSPSEGGVGAY